MCLAMFKVQKGLELINNFFQFCDTVFKTFDANGDGSIDFKVS